MAEPSRHPPTTEQVEPPASRRRAIFLHVTKQCNLRCSYCYFSASRPLPDEMTPEEFVALWPEVAAICPQKIVFTGGEPLLRPDILLLLRGLADHDPRIVRCLNTNGHFVTPEVACSPALSHVCIASSRQQSEAINHCFVLVDWLFCDALLAVSALTIPCSSEQSISAWAHPPWPSPRGCVGRSILRATHASKISLGSCCKFKRTAPISAPNAGLPSFRGFSTYFSSILTIRTSGMDLNAVA